MKRRKKRRVEMDNNNSNHSNNSFFSGFLLGVFVGAAVVFLLRTKKGKRIWKAISEKGIDNITNILEESDKTEYSNEVYGEPSYASHNAFASRDKKATEEQGENFTQERKFAVKEKSIEEKPRVRRFFRGISRRVN